MIAADYSVMNTVGAVRYDTDSCNRDHKALVTGRDAVGIPIAFASLNPSR